MRTQTGCFLVLFVFAVKVQAQDTLVAAALPDTVTVTAFNLHTQWKETPAAIAIINRQTLERLGQASLVPVFNTVAGVRMEERSPGSYRLSVRGSLLRSPFGIRNLKMYWDEIPLTDAGGNSYFNLVDFSQLQSAEIIKGPAASMYGANTGGAVLLHSIDMSPRTAGHNWELGMSGGAYGLFRQHAGYSNADTAVSIQLRQVHQQSDGYRQQSRLRKDGVQVNSRIRLNRHQQLSVMAFYTDLYYQTPGGITLQQMEQDPKLARQKTPTLPGSVEQQAAIYNKTAFGGLRLVSNLGDHWQHTTVVTLNHTDFRNPFITNYEQRNEWNYGGRTAFRYRKACGRIQWNATAGAEWLQNKAAVDNYGNRAGIRDTVQYKDRLRATQAFAFAQGDLHMGRWLAQGGVSHNLLTYHYRRITDAASADQEKNLGNVWAPRFSVLYQLTRHISMYVVAAKGFSPPSLAEVRPSDGNYYGDLQPEHGWNYEAGLKGALWQNRIRFDINAYNFQLKDAIVRRTNTAGADYFANAGGTSQKGMECFVEARLFPFLTVYHSFSYQPYHFTTYQVAGAYYSGNRITGVPRTVQVSGIDLLVAGAWYATVVLNHTAAVTLNDAATVSGDSYRLLQARIGHSWKIGQVRVEVFAAADNLLNEVYSLGNDLNAMGNRYYNPAPARNFSGGMLLRL